MAVPNPERMAGTPCSTFSRTGRGEAGPERSARLVVRLRCVGHRLDVGSAGANQLQLRAPLDSVEQASVTWSSIWAALSSSVGQRMTTSNPPSVSRFLGMTTE